MTPDSRRRFLQSAAGLAALAPAAAGAAPQPLTLPTVKFGKTEVTRMILGSNPFYGYSHFNKIFDQTMKEWYTQDRRMEVMHACERQGINTWQVHYDPLFEEDFRRYRAEGGKMHVVLLAQNSLMENPAMLRDVAKLGPLGVAHHGNVTDNRFRAGEKGKVRDFLKAVRDAGVMVGLSTHNPGVVDTVESEGWDLDYYQTCLYRVTRTAEEARAEYGEAPIAEIYMEKDPERMCKMIRQTKKPCLAFKLFGAGRTVNRPAQIEAAFRYAFANIKPTDPVIVGMFPKYSDQVKENKEMVRKILAKNG
jgi:hypothetical protein